MKEPKTDAGSMDALLDEAVTVAAGLEALNETLELQRRSILQMTEQMASATVDLVNRALAMDSTKTEASALAGQAAAKSPDTEEEILQPEAISETGDAYAAESATVDSAARQSMARAYEDTLTVMRQQNVIAQAAMNQGIVFLYACVGEALGAKQNRDQTENLVTLAGKTSK